MSCEYILFVDPWSFTASLGRVVLVFALGLAMVIGCGGVGRGDEVVVVVMGIGRCGIIVVWFGLYCIT